MNTQIIKIDSQAPDYKVMEAAGAIIRSGGLVAFPTETVYGLGGDALNPGSAQKIYEAKGRPSDNPLIVHICRFEDLAPLVEEVSEEVERLQEAFWPGPLTIILRKSNLVPKETTGGLDTVAVRMPSHPAALEFIAAAGGYVAAPSANLSGRPSPTKAQHVVDDMDGKVELILDGDDSQIGLESTIIDMTGELPTILRPGYITQEMLQKVLGEVQMDSSLSDTEGKEPPRAPGMKYRHYAPKGELWIIEGPREAVVFRINELIKKAHGRGEKAGVIGTKETVEKYRADSVKCIGGRREEETIAKNLYTLLREFDDEQIEIIYSESFSDCSMGQAIMNRLLKAAGHKIEIITESGL